MLNANNVIQHRHNRFKLCHNVTYYSLVRNTDGNQRMTQMYEKLLTWEGRVADLIEGFWGDSSEKSKFELNSKGLVGVTQLERKKKCDVVLTED